VKPVLAFAGRTGAEHRVVPVPETGALLAGGRVSLVMGELVTGEGVTGLAVGASDGDADTGA
jgi:hypothetical protein